MARLAAKNTANYGMSVADMNRWQFGYAISNHTHTLQDHFALYIMFTYQSKDTETWHNYLQGNLSLKDPSVGRLLGSASKPPRPIRYQAGSQGW